MFGTVHYLILNNVLPGRSIFFAATHNCNGPDLGDVGGSLTAENVLLCLGSESCAQGEGGGSHH